MFLCILQHRLSDTNPHPLIEYSQAYVMSINPGGPIQQSLTEWTESSISDIYSATAENSFDTVFNAFLSDDARITVNGKHLTRDQYKQLLRGEQTLEHSANVTFNNSVAVPTDPGAPSQSQVGNVGIFYTAQIVEGINELGAPATRTVRSALNVLVVGNGVRNGRKVSALDQVISTETNPVQPLSGSK